MRNTIRNGHAAMAFAALLLFAGCGSIGDLGGGGNTPTTGTSAADEIRGTVDYVDTRDRSVVLSGVNQYDPRVGGSDTVRVYYDDRTPVQYQGRTYRPENLERGDQISARVEQSGGRLIASSMTVLYNAGGTGGTGTGTYPGDTTAPNTIRGSVQSVDTGRRLIVINRGTGQNVTVEYNSDTPVYYRNERYRPDALERGDEIDVRVRQLGGGRYAAESIDVIRNVGDATQPAQSMLRGTVRNVNTTRQTIDLDQVSWSSTSRFTPGAAGGGLILRYDSTTVVEYQGRTYAPNSLDPGDIVDVRVRDLGAGSFFAERIIVVRDINQR